jgi:O-antigen/teichoic acid export membrane protein
MTAAGDPVMGDNTAKIVTKNVAVLSFTRVITTSSTLMLMMFLPRYLGPVGYGRLYLGQAIVGIFALVIEFGGNYTITKSVSRNPENIGSIFVNAVGIRSMLWIVSYALMLCYAFAAGYPAQVVFIIAIYGIGMMWSGLNAVLGSCFRGVNILRYPAYGGIVETVFIAAVGIPALLFGFGPVQFAVLSVVGTFLGGMTVLRFRSVLFTALPPFEWDAAKTMLSDGFPYFLNAVFGVIYFRIDTVMLSLMTSDHIVGWYGAAYRFFDSLMIIPNIFTIAIFPVLSRRWGSDPHSFPRMMQKSLDAIILAAIPMCILAFAYAPEIIHVFYGSTMYEPSILLLRIFSIGIPLLYIDFVLGTMLMAADKQRGMTRIAFYAIFMNIGLNYVLITWTQAHLGNGGIGSAVATLATELFVMARMVFMMPKTAFEGVGISLQVKALLSGLAMAVVMRASHSMPLMVEGLLSVSAYAATIILTRALGADDVAMITTVLTDRYPGLRRLAPEPEE